MKIILSSDIIVSTVIGVFVLMIGNSAYAAEAEMGPLMVDTNFTKLVDVRLLVLSKNPKLLRLLDQQNQFMDEDTYNKVKKRSLEHAESLLPGIFKRPTEGVVFSDIAVCPDDFRIFFYSKRNDYDVLGWCPILRTDSIDSSPDLTILIVPRKDQNNQLTRSWNARNIAQSQVGTSVVQSQAKTTFTTNLQDNEIWKQWIQDVTQESLKTNLVKFYSLVKKDNVLEAKAFLRSPRGNHRVTEYLNDNAMCIKLAAFSEESKAAPLKLTPEKPWLKETGGLPPFWPPKGNYQTNGVNLSSTNEITVMGR